MRPFDPPFQQPSLGAFLGRETLDGTEAVNRMTGMQLDRLIRLGDKARGLAREYLLSFAKVGLTDKVLDSYLEPNRARLRPRRLNDIDQRLLRSGQNANMRAGVVGKSIGGVEALGPILFDFDPIAGVRHFSGDWEEVLNLIEVACQQTDKPSSIPPGGTGSLLSLPNNGLQSAALLAAGDARR